MITTQRVEFLGVHEEMRRLVLRARWVRWSLRNWKPGDYRWPCGRHVILSERLTAFAPTHCQRAELAGGDEEDMA